MAAVPNDSVMLLSFINTQLRDFYPSLEELCRTLDISRAWVIDRLGQIDYTYDEQNNQFK